MKRKMKKAILKILKVIKLFEDNVIILVENKKLKLDEYGNPILSREEIKVKMAIMTPKKISGVQISTIENSFLSFEKEAYYILNENDEFKISENMRIKYKNKIYKVINIENNYDVFLRLGLNIDDRRD